MASGCFTRLLAISVCSVLGVRGALPAGCAAAVARACANETQPASRPRSWACARALRGCGLALSPKQFASSAGLGSGLAAGSGSRVHSACAARSWRPSRPSGHANVYDRQCARVPAERFRNFPSFRLVASGPLLRHRGAVPWQPYSECAARSCPACMFAGLASSALVVLQQQLGVDAGNARRPPPR